mgnify:CR=1 FL=1|tara:strand:- start:800 stop:988 length:189 start_codon:yes stop_codon:yes gene_type:complete
MNLSNGESQRNEEERKVWTYYGMLAVIIVLYSVMGSPKKGVVAKLWMGYCVGAALMGFYLYN